LSIIDRQDRNENPRFFNGLEKRWCYFVTSLKLSIINEGVDSLATKSSVEISSKTVASVTTSKTKKHVIGESIGEGRGGRGDG